MTTATTASKIEVQASCEDESGGGDAAYDLCGEFTPEEFADTVKKVLESNWGLANAQGEVSLNIVIRKVAK